MVLLMLSLSLGGYQIVWNSPMILTCLSLSVDGFVLFWWVERNFLLRSQYPNGCDAQSYRSRSELRKLASTHSKPSINVQCATIFLHHKSYTAAQVDA